MNKKNENGFVIRIVFAGGCTVKGNLSTGVCDVFAGGYAIFIHFICFFGGVSQICGIVERTGIRFL
ncbi:hypothetical protein BOVA208_3920 [Bacteroides ovatus]|nr:hypothetical protein BOVA208_3920 [Bacteroides ovatus]